MLSMVTVWSPLLALAAAGLPLAAVPDVLTPGHRPVVHEMVVEAGGVPQGMRLVAAPVRGFGGVHEVVPGQPFGFSAKYGTRLYLLPADASLPAEWSRDWIGVHPCSDRFDERASVPLGAALARVLTTWRVLGVQEGRILMQFVREQHFDAAANPLTPSWRWLLLLAIAAGGAFWLVRTARSRSPDPAEAG